MPGTRKNRTEGEGREKEGTAQEASPLYCAMKICSPDNLKLVASLLAAKTEVNPVRYKFCCKFPVFQILPSRRLARSRSSRRTAFAGFLIIYYLSTFDSPYSGLISRL